jgi:hypothetical protein
MQVLEAPVAPSALAPIGTVELALLTERVLTTPDILPPVVVDPPAIARPLVERVVGGQQGLFGKAQEIVRAAASLTQSEPGDPPEIESELSVMQRHSAMWNKSLHADISQARADEPTGEFPTITLTDDEATLTKAVVLVQLAEKSLEAALGARTGPLDEHSELVAVRQRAETDPPHFNKVQKWVVGYAMARFASRQADARQVLAYALANGRRTVDTVASQLDHRLNRGRFGMVAAAAQIARLL